jgi:hypothetical protein
MPFSFQFSLLIQILGKYGKAMSLDTDFTDLHGLKIKLYIQDVPKLRLNSRL